MSSPTVDFGEAMVRGLKWTFEGENVDRVIDSWNRLRNGDEFEKDWGEGKGLQRAGSYIEGLSAEPWHDISQYPWAKSLEAKHMSIKNELKATQRKKDLAQKGNNVWVPAARDDGAAYGPDWRTLVLQDRGVWDPVNVDLFPKTTRIIQELRVPSAEVFFARQKKNSGIKAHTDNTNFILTAHLGLEVPQGECWMRVGTEKRQWATGKALVFDTSFEHETMNESRSKDRTVLLIRFWHPEVTLAERAALQFIFSAIADPTILDKLPASR